MDTKFVFNAIRGEEIPDYVEKSNVFNLCREDVEKEKVTLTHFEDKSLGSSVEKLDVAIYRDGDWSILDIDDKIKDFNEIPIGYLVSGEDYSRVLVIIRRMSNLILDEKREGCTSYVLCVVPDKYKDVSKDTALFGLLAKSKVYLDGSDEDIRNQVQSNIVDRTQEICSRLFE